jgi:GntR family transcriptional regulator, transcriptional repressor for pyruvate dehydrogenase complex
VVGPVKSGSLTPGARPVKTGGRSRRTPGGSGQLIQPIRKTRLAEEIADRIRVLILDGTLAAGKALPGERDLASRFGVSRGSVRDALRMLETIGLLETRHGQGTFPRELDVDRLVAPLASILTYRSDLRDELIDVRRMFEPAVARAAAARVTDDDLADLQRIVDTQRRRIKAGGSTIVEDTAFHAALARATRNRVVMQIMETLNNLLVESRKLTLKQKGRPERSVQGHEAVVAALERRDPDGAAHAMQLHIEQIAALVEPRSDARHAFATAPAAKKLSQSKSSRGTTVSLR